MPPPNIYDIPSRAPPGYRYAYLSIQQHINQHMNNNKTQSKVDRQNMVSFSLFQRVQKTTTFIAHFNVDYSNRNRELFLCVGINIWSHNSYYSYTYNQYFEICGVQRRGKG